MLCVIQTVLCVVMLTPEDTEPEIDLAKLDWALTTRYNLMCSMLLFITSLTNSALKKKR